MQKKKKKRKTISDSCILPHGLLQYSKYNIWGIKWMHCLLFGTFINTILLKLSFFWRMSSKTFEVVITLCQESVVQIFCTGAICFETQPRRCGSAVFAGHLPSWWVWAWPLIALSHTQLHPWESVDWLLHQMTFYLALSNFHSSLQCPCLSFSCSELNISCFVLHRTTPPFLWEPHPTLLVLSRPFSDSLVLVGMSIWVPLAQASMCHVPPTVPFRVSWESQTSHTRAKGRGSRIIPKTEP